MKLTLATFSLLTFVASSSAQYFSAGWNPGQKQPEPQSPEEPVAVKSTPIAEPGKFSLSSLFDMDRILTSGPSVALFNTLGINITERVEAALLSKIWDERVQLITDDNYNDLIVNEILTEQEEKDRLWLIVISVTAVKSDGLSKYLDSVFDAAFNESLIAGDLPNVKWGRIDYLNVTAITTKWAVWQAPTLVVLKDRGKTLRFYRPQRLRLREDALREFLKLDGWKATPPWSSAYAPGGSKEYIMDYFAFGLTKVYNTTKLIPRWLLVLVSGTMASLIISFLHRPSKPAVKTQPKSKSIASTPTATHKPIDAPAQSDPESPAPRPKRTGAKQRKPKT